MLLKMQDLVKSLWIDLDTKTPKPLDLIKVKVRNGFYWKWKWWAFADLNCGPADYESDALTNW